MEGWGGGGGGQKKLPCIKEKGGSEKVTMYDTKGGVGVKGEGGGGAEKSPCITQKRVGGGGEGEGGDGGFRKSHDV